MPTPRSKSTRSSTPKFAPLRSWGSPTSVCWCRIPDSQMIPLVLIVLIALLVTNEAEAFNSFQLVLVPHSRDCFYEKLAVGEKLDLSFEVYDGGNLDIDFWVTSPDDQILHSIFKQSTGTVEVKAEKEGSYTYCFSNQMSTVTQKVLTFSVHGPEERERYDEKYKGLSDEDFHSPLNEEIARLADAINSVMDEQFYMRDRLERHHKTAKSTNQRVAWWSIFQGLVLVGVCGFQVFYISRFFESKRLV
ncbi:supernatant protein factor, C-terminal domain-containing protein [Zopfochytrium polystomum]|nr:supernatant protein factor, C-terminal domain-containing protein [Zopfochytrium polystomum]